MISRRDWSAKPAKILASKLELPTLRVIITGTDSEECGTQVFIAMLSSMLYLSNLITLNILQEECIARVQAIQHTDMESKIDIGYNFLIGGDGSVYEGRGWDIQGDHTPRYNENSIAIAFIGKIDNIELRKSQSLAAQKLLQQDVKLNKLDVNYRLYIQCQLEETDCPIQQFLEEVKSWGDHWNYDIA